MSSEVVVLMPVLVLLVLLCVQVAAWHHAATVATSVAARVAAVEARYGAQTGQGEQLAVDLMRQLDATLAAPVEVTRSVGSVRADVAVAVPALVPGLPQVVRRTATAVRERFVSEGER